MPGALVCKTRTRSLRSLFYIYGDGSDGSCKAFVAATESGSRVARIPTMARMRPSRRWGTRQKDTSESKMRGFLHSATR